MNWRLAKALEQLRSQVDTKWPGRSRQSDGTIGNAEHSSRTSDHNPNPDGVVCALDITHDPRSGCDSYALAASLVASHDPRIKYVISNGKICSGSAQTTPAWIWRKYTGKNRHDHHCHVSVKPDKAHYDSVDMWSFDLNTINVATPAAPYVPPPATLRQGMTGPDVKRLQTMLGLTADGQFGPKTVAAVKAIQKLKGLVEDGICGPATMSAL